MAISNFFVISTLPVSQNVVKNILFRAATIVLTFVTYRIFAFIAFKKNDYTSFLMFGEDYFQKGFFVFSRGFTKQAFLVATFACIMGAAGFYDTMLWALDSPGYVAKKTQMNAGQLSSQMLDSPGYIILLSHPQNNLSLMNLNDTFGANLYVPGLNFTLPGVNAPGVQETVPAVLPLSFSVPPNIWLDSDGWAVGLDNTFMFTPDMNTTATFCVPSNVAPNQQGWKCSIRNSDALALFDTLIGRPQIWWNVNITESLYPFRKDNPWMSLGTGANTAIMKQLFTVTKGTRRHTFLHTTLKATMISSFPVLLNDAEITDFMRKMWSTSPSGAPLPSAVQDLVDIVIEAKNNQTSLSFGSFFQVGSTSVYSFSTDYLNVLVGSVIDYASLRFVSSTISLLRSEDIPTPLIPFDTCDRPYSNHATGGVVREVNCFSIYASNVTNQYGNSGSFLGQIDASSVFIMSDILGDGTKNTSDSSLNPVAATWYSANAKNIEQLLISRGLILGGVRSDVTVNVQHNEAALSYLQLLLTIIPVIITAVVIAITFHHRMSYFTNSFLAAVCATTHLGSETCEKVNYVKALPEIIIQSGGTHVFLGTPKGSVIAIVDQEPLMLNTDSQSPMEKLEGSSEVEVEPHSNLGTSEGGVIAIVGEDQMVNHSVDQEPLLSNTDFAVRHGLHSREGHTYPHPQLASVKT